MKKGVIKRALAFALAAAMTVTMFPNVGNSRVIEAKAASIVTNENLFKNPTYEEGVELGAHTEETQFNKLGNWFAYSEGEQLTVQKVQNNAHSGNWAVSLSAANDALEQDVSGLTVGANYKVSVWAKNTNPSAVRAWLCVKWYGGNEQKVLLNSSEYKRYEIPFTYTGDNTGKNMRAAIWVENGGAGNVYVDDWTMEIDSDIKSLSAVNGAITAEYKADYAGNMSADDFDISYTSSLAPEVSKKIEVTNSSTAGKVLTINFAEIEKSPLEQKITITATYKPSKQPFIVDFDLAASGEGLVEAVLTEIQAENGRVVAQLDAVPTVAPKKEDFVVEYKINDGEFTPVNVKDFVYDKDAKNVTMTFDKISGAADTKNVTVKVTYKDVEKTADFVVELGNGVIYYVDATMGQDTNNGTSPETAWKSIDRVNQEVFQPGDQILFKAGEEWTGALKPQGSGVDGAPIVIASYGEGKKPLLKPGADWKISHMNVANRTIWGPTVNNVITFLNQEYWEVRDLELYDPTYANNASTRVYRRGINVSAEDAGDLHYFKFDNLTIHGFRGPNDNDGKSSGGIIMTVTTNLNNPSKRVPTAVHDISVTNCELYDLGRSGINFISPWTTRQGDKWNKYQSFGYKGLGDWKPYERFTLTNNIIHDIDGDGTIVDGCKDVLVAHNTVYRTVLNCWYGVGLFNWNSDNVVFEYNEVYDASPADALLKGGDGQGIEIDALNQNTVVQYNYLHNNAGGVFMWCCTPDLRGFNGIYRYNISQNDGAKHGVIDWRPGHEGSMAYNNTIYLDGGIDREWLKNGYTQGKSDAKFYNNIVVNKGNMTLGAGFNEREIDYESNIFVGFDQVPTNDSTVIQEDPMFVAPGTGGKGIHTLEGYKLQAGSPAIDAGVNIENNGGKDYFGTPLTDGKTDIGASEFVALDKSGLQALIEQAEAVDREKYTEDTVAVLEEKLAAAKEVLDNAKNQDEITAAEEALKAALDNLALKPPVLDKTQLESLIEQASKIDTTKYTEESVKALEEALASAKNILETAKTQEEIASAEAGLKSAIDGLTEKPVEPQEPEEPQKPEEPQNPEKPQNPEEPQKPEKPQNPEKPQKPSGNQPGKNDTPKTGDDAKTVPVACVSLVSLGTIIFVLKKKRMH